MLTACLNGSRRPGEHPAVPLTPAQLAEAGAQAVAAGAHALHVHPRDDRGDETLDARHVDAVVAAVRAAAPGVVTGVTTGAWIAPDPEARLGAVRSWHVLPDVVSVNWHEPGAERVADALLSRGTGVEAGLWDVEAARFFVRGPLAGSCCRILLEPMEPSVSAALGTAERMLDLVAPLGVPIQLHGCERTTWPVLASAARQGFEVRIGLEDVLLLPDGTPAAGNADLVAAAVAVIDGSAVS
ncbi:hypothetical protein HC031_27985 [Planosporangium thailandense]|uniref:3-keto-5-aminohexanoate cleavage protein n=1 Tax=Planosporangium thailandense TaxID=765197 RepID=A0ABX0Y5X4_9ACTN|nr:hypothetical protein [Planosporangium thailandense]